MKRDLITGNIKSSTWRGIILCTSSHSGPTGRWIAEGHGGDPGGWKLGVS